MNEKNATAKIIRARISPKKLGPVVDLVKDKSLNEALVLLKFDSTKAAKLILKAVKSAEANAITNNKMDRAKLYLDKIWVGPGPMMKSGVFVGRGYFGPILKRTSNIYVSLGERGK